jgi:4a-hydroxytetrahydrobiopterin dehydratase
VIEQLSISARSKALQELSGWIFDNTRQALYKRVEFSDFAQALSFMVRVGVLAERMDHHPEWTNVYNRVDIWLTTHDCAGVSQRDIDLAAVIDGIIGKA